MSELLDALEDSGVLDGETQAFLIEALLNSEADDYADVLAPFLEPAQALQVLQTVPNVLERSQKALDKRAEDALKASRQETDPLAEAFLKVLPHGVLKAIGMHTFGRCARACRAMRLVCIDSKQWRSTLESTCSLWSIPMPKHLRLAVEHGHKGLKDKADEKINWRHECLALLRPRCDGIYVGECKFKRWLRLGHHQDLRKNAEQLAMKAGRGGGAEWVDYRRYVRLLPPNHEGDGLNYALVLQDPCPLAVAEDVLCKGVDADHKNPEKAENVLTANSVPCPADPDRLKKRICRGTYTYENGQVKIQYSATEGIFNLTFALSHGGRRICSDKLRWDDYNMQDASSEVINFNLGKLEDWKGGGLADENKDHFPEMHFRPTRLLEHLA